MKNIFASALLICFTGLSLLGCSSRPLGLSDEEWARLTPQQQLDASKEQARLDTERKINQEKERTKREALRIEQQRQVEQQEISQGRIVSLANICIGGDKCPKRSTNGESKLIIPLGAFVYIDAVYFEAHDRIGSKHDGKIALYADNHPIARNVDIKKSGSTHTFVVGRLARNIILSTETGDEVYFKKIKIFGQPLNTPSIQIHLQVDQ